MSAAPPGTPGAAQLLDEGSFSMKLTRWAATALAATAALVLAACSGPAEESADDSTGTTTASDGAFPATVDTTFGEITIDEQPERVVALGWGDAEVALALGVEPVGASDWLGFGGDGVGPWSDGYTTSPEIVETLEPSYEQIAALEPDLILDVKSSGDKERYDRLSQIATTVGVPEGGENYLTRTEQQTMMIAAALGVPKEGAAQLEALDKAFAEAAKAHPDWSGKTATAATRTSEGWGAYVEGSERVVFLERLGFTPSPTVADLPANESGFSVDISDEQLDLLDADLIVAFPIFIETAQITDDPQWKAVPAVADGRAVVIDGDLAQAYSLGTPQAQVYAVDELSSMIEASLGS
ncbi:iron-siderophore ABC transporter substrate-binding protein [Isoptericola sp. NEAU-Y5]|uniref:Iron-siderophore ABC transporter substrate-binding protein n=1 Tax=Isoptericola luteus TaxID=2879484 RepID=A0ABS7ZF12_9MICO|nr:iron-siderophore ABC transporter substrate-binding protein [Isoptericola sp. NEAU-Y5]MCA5893633.1 iron-siderophore ABC transporter substrate-binding protein [Isoptericola sp. NEAU-Y5]